MVLVMANNGMPLPAPPPSSTATTISTGNAYSYYENGRAYHSFRKGKYLFPCDDQEMDRMDIYHKLFLVARNETLHSAPLTIGPPNSGNVPRILDLGTGTGIWAIDMAEKYRDGEVLGFDLSWTQPPMIPGNLSFSQRDIESPWHGMDLDSWDLIHLRMLNGSITNWPDIYAKVFRHLKPALGWMEQVEIDMTPRCDDGTLPQNSNLNTWSALIHEATAMAYRPIAYNPNTGALLQQQGFTDIRQQVIRLPLNPWEKDPHLKDVGRWYNLGLTQGLEALTLAPLMRMLNWERADVDRLVANTKREICSKRYHTYCNMHIWIARRPGAA